MDVRDLLVMLDLFNIEAFPNEGMDHPVRAYASKAKVLDSYLSNQDHYKLLSPILNDVLRLHDIIRLQGRDKHNETGALMRATQETSDENKRKVHAIGRSRNHWSTLHSIVAKHQLMMTR